jgi:hypothetical protein
MTSPRAISAVTAVNMSAARRRVPARSAARVSPPAAARRIVRTRVSAFESASAPFRSGASGAEDPILFDRRAQQETFPRPFDTHPQPLPARPSARGPGTASVHRVPTSAGSPSLVRVLPPPTQESRAREPKSKNRTELLDFTARTRFAIRFPRIFRFRGIVSPPGRAPSDDPQAGA